MKKLLILSSAILMAGACNANAQVSVTFGAPVVAEPVVEEPYLVAPDDWPSQRYDHHRYPHDAYWARQGHPHPVDHGHDFHR